MDLFFRTEGSGEPVVIIHGLYGSSDNWLTVAKKLSIKHKVFSVDQRNHGKSPVSDIHNYDAMKDDIASFFDKQKIEKAIVIGHSMGGKTAMSFAADYPERIEKLIIVDIAPKDYFLLNDQSQYYLHSNILRAMLEIDFEHITSRKDVEINLRQKIDNIEIVYFLLKNVYRDKLSHKYKWRINVDALYNNLDEIIAGVNANYFDDRLPILNYPVLFIKGEQSPYIKKEDYPSIYRIYPESKIVEINNAGHWVHAEQPPLFMAEIWKFLKV